MTTPSSFPQLGSLVRLALEEDVGSGDVTTLWTVGEEMESRATIVAKQQGVIAGTAVSGEVFRQVDQRVSLKWAVEDGTPVQAGLEIAMIHGPSRSILTAERVALNFLQRLSGIATLTAEFAGRVEGTGARILDTRKTTPLLRSLEKAAVRAGGGLSHRRGLFDMVLVKENHLRSAGGIRRAVEAVRAASRDSLDVEVETETLDEVREAAEAGVDRILLDNMSPQTLAVAVDLVRSISPGTETEASGGVSLATVREIAESGVDYISVGALTHSAPALDLSLLLDQGDGSPA